ncbi:hypothetical protein, partial [Pseudomonas aeruginosa]|uniref:hypothetical protein n=1 Tax=Pseudomonas aeruginosa TaxID=287 RepID=UPI001FF95780
MRAVASTIVLLMLCGFAYAEESTPLATQAGEVTAPIAEAIDSGFSRIVTGRPQKLSATPDHFGKVLPHVLSRTQRHRARHDPDRP